MRIKMIRYFAYGSNMDKKDFEQKCKDKGWRKVKFLNTRPAKLEGYRLTFNYYSKCRYGGAANIMEDERGCVYGLISDIEESDLETIRKKEGYSEDCKKCYYDEVCVDVEVDEAVVPHVKTYKVAEHRETPNHQPPTKEYLNLIIRNAEKYHFPNEYIKFLNSIPTKD